MKIKILFILGVAAVIGFAGWAIFNPAAFSQFRVRKALGMSLVDLGNPLVLKQIVTGQEPDIATFEVPIRYGVLTNVGSLRLLLDAELGELTASQGATFQNCEGATNGNCLLVWNTTYDPPGQHALQAQFLYTGKT